MSKFLLTVFCIIIAAVPVLAQKTNDAQQTASVKAAVARIGARNNSLVQVKRFGKPKVKGSISEIREDDFEVISSQNRSIGVAVSILYDEVAQIKSKDVDWGNVGARASLFGVKAFKVIVVVLQGVNPQFPP